MRIYDKTSKDKSIILYTVIFLIMLFSAARLWAGDVNVPNTFNNGDIADANDVNENFNAVESAIDDNDTRLDALEAMGLVSNAAGIEYRAFTNFISISGSDTSMRNLGSLTLSAPANGYVLVILTGEAVFFGDNRTIDVGIGSSTSSFLSNASIGRLDGSGTARFYSDYTAMAVVPVSAGNHTFYALARGSSTFDSNSVNVVPVYMVAIYFTNRY